MATYLFDEGLDSNVAKGLRQAGFETYAVGDDEAPARRSSDGDNVAWCEKRKAVLMTNDHGRKNREILDLLREHPGVHSVFVADGLAGKELTMAFTKHYATMEEKAQRGNEGACAGGSTRTAASRFSSVHASLSLLANRRFRPSSDPQGCNEPLEILHRTRRLAADPRSENLKGGLSGDDNRRRAGVDPPRLTVDRLTQCV